MAVDDLFALGAQYSDINFYMSFYEIYGGRCFDLLDGQKKVEILEDGNNNVETFSSYLLGADSRP